MYLTSAQFRSQRVDLLVSATVLYNIRYSVKKWSVGASPVQLSVKTQFSVVVVVFYPYNASLCSFLN